MNYRSLLSIALIGLSIAISNFISPPAQADGRFSEMVVFGDSFSDTGNALVWSGGVLMAPPYFEGRASNGPVFVEQAALRLGLPAPSASLLGGTNYAFSSAPTGGDAFFDTPTLGEQIDMFFSEGNSLDGDELIVVQGGTNDALWFVLNRGLVGNGPQKAVDNIADYITNLAASGGDVFVVPNILTTRLPLIDLDPLLAPIAPAFKAWVLEFNTLLDRELNRLEADLGILIVNVDQKSVFDEMLTNSRFGFANDLEPACPGCGFAIPIPDAESTIVDQPHRYVFWDLVHPTSHGHQILGNAFARDVNTELAAPQAAE